MASRHATQACPNASPASPPKATSVIWWRRAIAMVCCHSAASSTAAGLWVSVGVRMMVAVFMMVFMVMTFLRFFMRRVMCGSMQVKPRKRLCHHRRVEVAAFAGVDLNRRNAGGTDAFGIQTGLLVTFDHRQRQVGLTLAQGREGGAPQRGFASPCARRWRMRGTDTRAAPTPKCKSAHPESLAGFEGAAAAPPVLQPQTTHMATSFVLS